MMVESCPKCTSGKLYSKKEDTTGITIRICYSCGYYEDDSEGYEMNPELHKRLFKKYFPFEVKWTPPENKHPFTTPKESTEPK